MSPMCAFLEPPNNPFRDDFPRVDIAAPGMEGEWWKEMRKLVEDGELIIPRGTIFAMGDNRDDSQDSRYWASCRRENIIGRPLRFIGRCRIGTGVRRTRLRAGCITLPTPLRTSFRSHAGPHFAADTLRRG